MEGIIFNFFMFCANFIFKLFGGLPDMPEPVILAIDGLFGVLFTGLTLVNLFVDLQFVILLADVTIGLVTGMMTFKLVMWIVRKLPIGSE